MCFPVARELQRDSAGLVMVTEPEPRLIQWSELAVVVFSQLPVWSVTSLRPFAALSTFRNLVVNGGDCIAPR